MKRGVPPTARKARTGELTPPGMTRWARSNNELPRWWHSRAFSGPGRSDRVLPSLPSSKPPRRRRLPPIDRSSPSPPSAWRQGPEEAVGHDVAHAGRKPASRLWSRNCSASPTAADNSPPEASSAASAAERVSPAPTKPASKSSNFSPVIAPCGEASTLSIHCSLLPFGSLGGSMTPVTSTKRVPCSPAATANSRADGARSLSHSGSRKSVSVLWLPTSTSVGGQDQFPKGVDDRAADWSSSSQDQARACRPPGAHRHSRTGSRPLRSTASAVAQEAHLPRRRCVTSSRMVRACSATTLGIDGVVVEDSRRVSRITIAGDHRQCMCAPMAATVAMSPAQPARAAEASLALKLITQAGAGRLCANGSMSSVIDNGGIRVHRRDQRANSVQACGLRVVLRHRRSSWMGPLAEWWREVGGEAPSKSLGFP